MKNRDRKSSAGFIFVGALLIVVFGVGLATSRNPGALLPRYRYDYAFACARNGGFPPASSESRCS